MTAGFRMAMLVSGQMPPVQRIGTYAYSCAANLIASGYRPMLITCGGVGGARACNVAGPAAGW